MEVGEVCALCPQKQQHPDCNSNKCANKATGPLSESSVREARGLVGSSDSELDDDRHLTDSHLLSLQGNNTNGSSQPSSCSGSIMHDSTDYQWCLDYGYNKEYHNLKKFPQSILSPAFEPNLVASYDDVAKNIDANLAEIDMETFRSEDIHSILALPAIYSGELQGSRHQGEKGASCSESLLGAFELDSSVSPRSTSESGSTSMSICKDEPLFSPLREHQIPPIGTISTDSLDCGSSFAEPDLVLTCRANKNNYTIAFEGSGPQFSDDSDCLEVEGSSGADSGLWQEQDVGGSNRNSYRNGEQAKGRGDMIQSDCVFTTWSKLRRLKETSRSYNRKCKTSTNGGKSQSLPNLLRQSVVSAERAAMESSWEKGKLDEKESCLPLFDIQNSHLTRSKDSEGSSGGPVSLLKLFIQHRASCSSMDGGSMCSSQSEASASSSSQQHPSDCLVTVMSRNEVEKRKMINANNDKFDNTLVFANHQTNELEDEEERNNNNVPPTELINNRNLTKTGEFNSESEEDSSQCFEDSLMEVHLPRNVALQASVIKEEDEPTENSSSDETMQDMKDPFLTDSGSGSGTSEEAGVTKNNAIKIRQSKRNDKMDRITNVFSTGKSHQQLNIACCTTMDDKLMTTKSLDLVPAIQTQGTQTKFVNQRKAARTSSNSGSTESLPLSATMELEDSVSSSSRCSPTPRASPALSPCSPIKKLNVSIATTRTCGTQIPVHIKDQEVQTSVHEDQSLDGWSFTLKENLSTDEGDDSTMKSISHCMSPVERPKSPLPPAECKENANRIENKEQDELEDDEDDEDEDDDDDLKPRQKSIYVCYPNYSLPDLSFLRTLTASPETKEGTVILKPTCRRQPLRQPAQRRSYSSEGRETQSRAKSCSEFDTASTQNFGHIRDWESLKVLLPEDIRNIITSMRQSGADSLGNLRNAAAKPRCGHRHQRSNKEGSPSSSISSSSGSSSSLGGTYKAVGPHYGVLKEVPPPIPKRSMSLPMNENGNQYPRSILRKSSSSGQCNNSSQSGLAPKCRSAPMMPWVEDAKSKRRSLQEPFHCLLDNIPESLQNSEHNLPPSIQPLYNMESSRIQEGGEEQPAAAQFFQAAPVLRSTSAQGCFTRSPKHYPVSRTRSDNCCTAYKNYTQADPRLVDGIGDKSDSSSDDSTSDLQKLLVSSAALNYADALLSGQNISPVLSPTAVPQSLSNETVDMGFLHCGCPRGKKTVSFCEDVDIHQKQEAIHQGCFNHQGPTSPCHCTSEVIEDIIKNSAIRSSKIGLLNRLENAVHILMDSFSELHALDFDPKEKSSLENLVLNNVCPALYTILADGLLPSINGLFGPLQNSPWRLAENSCQQDQKIVELLELIGYINGESTLSNNSTKFCAFLFGLLNLRMVDQWMARFLSCTQLIQQNYQPNAVVFLMSCVPSFMAWKRDLINTLKPLIGLNFQLDVLSPATVSPVKERVYNRKARPYSCVETGATEKTHWMPSSTSWEGPEPSKLDENLNMEDVEGLKYDGEKEYQEVFEDWDPPSEKGEKAKTREDSPGFQELRQKWEKMAAPAPSGVAPSTSPQLVPSLSVAASAKPPLPGSHRTREVVKKGPVKSNVQQPKGSPIHLRSKLPSPVRPNTPPNRSRPQTPESPRHLVRSPPSPATKAVTNALAARSASPAQPPTIPKAPRKSMIPVHKPPSARNTMATTTAKRQPVIARHPAPNSRNN